MSGVYANPLYQTDQARKDAIVALVTKASTEGGVFLSAAGSPVEGSLSAAQLAYALGVNLSTAERLAEELVQSSDIDRVSTTGDQQKYEWRYVPHAE